MIRRQWSDQYAFPYDLWRDFLAAYHVNESERHAARLPEHAHDPHWREVLLFTSGLLPASDEFLRSLTRLLEIGKPLSGLILWSKEATQHGRGHRLALQGVALYFIILLNTWTSQRPVMSSSGLDVLRDSLEVRLSVSLWELLTSFILSIDRSFDWIAQTDGVIAWVDRLEERNTLALDFHAFRSDFEDFIDWSSDASLELVAREQSLKQRVLVLANHLKLDSRWLEISTEELQTLHDYLYLTKLIVDCKRSARRVTQRCWTELEARLLSVPKEWRFGQAHGGG